MNLFADRSFTITNTDNGWVLEWKDDRMGEKYEGWVNAHKPKQHRGVEVFTDKEQLIRRITGLL